MNLLVQNRLPIHFLKTNPRGWIRASLAKFKASAQEVMMQLPLTQEELQAMSWSQRHALLEDYALKSQQKKWEEEVGIKPEDSRFTLIVPIHNEANSLPSFLNTLMLSDIPSAVNMNVIFIANACTDSSQVYIDEFLASLGQIENKLLTGEFNDQGLNRNYKAIKRSNISFMHVDTQTPGKANALGIGNSIARESGHIVAISVDANNYLEPDAIRVMFSHANNSFHDKLTANDIVLLTCTQQEESKASKLKHLLSRAGRMQQHLLESKSGEVDGCLMAWNTQWMESIGGPPAVALEDYAMGVIARVNNYRFEQIKEANIWSYTTNGLKGLLETRTRFVRGVLQLLDLVHHDPSVLQIVEKEAYYIQTLPFRLKYLLYKAKKSPENLPRYIATFLLWEYALRRGRRDYRRNPNDHSWKKIDATY